MIIMKIAIVGGSLQGIEATYLAKKAGFETVVVDKRNDAPAFSLSDGHISIDLTEQGSDMIRMFRDCDAVLPACEDINLLYRLNEVLSRSEIPFLFDMDSYMISSSKSASNRLMEVIGVPMPKKWQNCRYPVIVKPSSGSRGIGTTVAHSKNDVDGAVNKILRMGDEPVIQEFVTGKNVSKCIIGYGNRIRSFTTTESIPGPDHDCIAVRCSPNILSEEREEEFRKISERLAESIDLISLMDVEAIDTADGLKVIEMDARLPAQTPTALLSATGVNILEEMICPNLRKKTAAKVSSYEFFLIDGNRMTACGEMEFGNIRNPKTVPGLFGSDEMITDYVPGARSWRCAVINSANTEEQLERKRNECMERIMNECETNRSAGTVSDAVRTHSHKAYGLS